MSSIGQDDAEKPQGAAKVSGTRVKAVLRLLSQEAGFLVDPGVKASKQSDVRERETNSKTDRDTPHREEKTETSRYR